MPLLCYGKAYSCNVGDEQVYCLEQYINSTRDIKVSIPQNTYLLSRPLKVRSGVTLNGNGSTLIPLFSDFYSAVIIVKDSHNVTIKNMSIYGAGFFNESYNKLESSNRVCGFNMFTSGILIINSKNIRLYDLTISGVYNGIIVTGESSNSISESIILEGNKINNVGRSGITGLFSKNLTISENQINNVLGNHAKCEDNWMNLAKFADGIYLDSVSDVIVKKNIVDNVKRIAIVVEGRTDVNGMVIWMNDRIVIANNYIKNVNGCRGTENNAGVWIEPLQPFNLEAKTHINKTNNVTINDNYINNFGAGPCALFQYGVLSGANKSIIRNNRILYFVNDGVFKGIGIRCAYGYCIILDNKINYNTTAVMLNQSSNLSRYLFSGNELKNNNVIMAE